MHKKVELWFIGGAGCLVLAAVWGTLTPSGTALADHKPNHKPGGGGGGGDGGNTSTSVCVTFDDAVGDGIQSDWWPDATRGDNPYCDDKKEKVSARIDQAGHLNLAPNNWKRSGTRALFLVDFDVVIPGDGDKMPQFPLEIKHFHVGLNYPEFDLRAMLVGESQEMNLIIDTYDSDIIFFGSYSLRRKI